MNLESPRRGYIFQALGVMWGLTGAGVEYIAAATENVMMIISGFIILGVSLSIIESGKKMSASARQHHLFMENHRREVCLARQFDLERQNARWN